jgi:UMF1 family MFS transporter
MNCLSRLYPLRGLPKQRQLWSWISFDVANQSFTLLINTLLFAVFFSQVVVANDAVDDRWWAFAYGGSMWLAAMLAPILGAVADERACKKQLLVGSGLLCGLLTCGLGLLQPSQLGFALLLYIPANIAFAVGETFLASFLPALARHDQFGRVSGFSWGCAYAAALVLLGIAAAAMIVFNLRATETWRPLFVFAGLWFLLFTIPTMLGLREPAAPQRMHGNRHWLVVGFVRLSETMRAGRSRRDLMLLLAASLFFGTGISVVVSFASRLAGEFGFTQVALVAFIAVLTVSGVIGTIVPMLWQDRIGHRRSILLLLVLWLITTLGFAFYARMHESHLASGSADAFPTWPMWWIGNLLGFGLGSLGSANRAFVGWLSPPGREAETFGLWGLVWKLSAIMTFPFAWTKDSMGTSAALMVLAGFMLVGLVLACFVREDRMSCGTVETPDH